MRIELVSPRPGLIAALAARLRPEGRDYSRTWIVFPEKRPAFYLRKALAAREGAPFVPPRTDSLDGFIDSVFKDILGRTERPLDPLDAAALLLEIHSESPVDGGGGGFLSPDAFFPLGAKIYADLEELTLALADPSSIAGIQPLLHETVPAASLARLQSLALFHERFYARLAELNLSSPASRFRAVLDALTPDLFAGFDEIVFAGFFPAAQAERRLLRTMLGWEMCALVAERGRGLSAALEAIGVPPSEIPASADDGGPDPEIELIRAPDTHGQVFALNSCLASRLDDPAGFDERQAVVLPAAESLFPLFIQTLAGRPEEAFNISLGYPLARTPVYDFFHRLIEALQSRDPEGRFYAPHYLRFLLHPYTKNIYMPGPGRRSDLTRILVHAVEDALTGRRMKAFWSLAEIETDPGILEAAGEKTRRVEGAPDPAALIDHLRSIHDRTLRLFDDIANVGDFARRLAAALEWIASESTARLHPFFHPYAEAFLERLEALRGSLLAPAVFRDAAGYAGLFRKIVRAGKAPFQGTPLHGLQVLGFWEARGLPLDEVFLLDANEGVLPSFAREDTILPRAARRALGLPVTEDLERRMAYFLDTLLKGARTASLFFVESAESERSRFVERIVWERQKRDAEPRAESCVRTVDYRVALRTEGPGPVEKTPGIADFLSTFRFSATSLDAYLRCPLRFYYAYVLKLAEREDVSEVMDRRDIGSFVHAVLEDLFRPHVGRPLKAASLTVRALDRAVEARFREFYGGDRTGSAWLLERQVLRHLRDYLKRVQAPLIKGLEEEGRALVVEGLETKVDIEMTAGGRTFPVTARFDRVERRGGELYVLDYKTGAHEKRVGIAFWDPEGDERKNRNRLDLDKRETWNKAVGSLQGPLYVLAAARAYGLEPEKVRCRFLILGKNVLGPSIEFSPFDESDPDALSEQIGTMEHVISALVVEILDPALPFEPGGDGGRDCRLCPYQGLCR